MPGGDRTGPWGQGPRTGRAMGYCSGSPTPGFANPYGFGGRFRSGYGRGFGRGPGRGWRSRAMSAPPVWDAPSGEDERSHLEEVQAGLEKSLEDVRMRLKELSEAVKDK